MIGVVVMAAYLVLVCAGTYAATGSRGWFPGGEEREPAPQPEQTVCVPSRVRP